MCTRPGGLSEVKDATEEVQSLIQKVRGDLEEKVNTTFSDYIAVSFKTQVVEGTNYFVKVRVAETDYVHLRIYMPLPNTNCVLELTSFQLNKSKDDEIEYF